VVAVYRNDEDEAREQANSAKRESESKGGTVRGDEAESERKACSRIAVVEFSQAKWYLSTPPLDKGDASTESVGHARAGAPEHPRERRR
jgi:hypothetical protein